jgi:solute carrier family 39 (zinc transporter), member 7
MTLLAALVATAVVSTLPICCLFFIPRKSTSKNSVDEPKVSEGLLNIMLCFSAGALIGDALIHILLHSIFSDVPTEERVRYLVMSMLGGFVFFFACELTVRKINAPAEEENATKAVMRQSDITVAISKRGGAVKRKTLKHSDGSGDSPSVPVSQSSQGHSHSHSHCSHGHHHGHSHTGGLLSLFADALHNFTDGMALAVTFHQSLQLGLATALAILIHEVPHQIGDYAMLAKAGYSHSRAIRMQLYTATSAGVGAVVGYAIVNDLVPGASLVHNDQLLCFIGGGFLYVSCVSILPEVLGGSGGGGQASLSALQSAGQLFAMVVGMAMMTVIE